MRQCCDAKAHFAHTFSGSTSCQWLTIKLWPFVADTSNMLTHRAIALQNFYYAVKDVWRRLNIVPDALSRLFGELDFGQPVSRKPALASTF